MLVAKKLKLKKNKSKPKRQRTFTTSELSLPCDHTQHSLSELFRNDAFKRRPPPVPTAAPVKKQKSLKQLQSTKKRPKSRSRARLDRCETYEVIPYKNSFKSDIVFSNQDTKRQGWGDSGSAQFAIRLNQKYLPGSNNQLRISIRRQYQRKVEAAIKIQKVFRGFLTRKVLQNCMENEQKKLQLRLQQIKSKPTSNSISQHSSYFAEKENYSGDPPRRRAVDQQHLIDSLRDDSSSSSCSEEAVYRHHEAIYSHEEIGEFGSSQQEDFDQDAFDGHIIFQTNEEYIDSRKSSQQPQPKNKVSRNGNTFPIAQEQQGEELVKTQKKPEWNKAKLEEQQEEIREVTLKLNEESRVSQKLGNFLQNEQGMATLKGCLQSQNERVEVQRLKEEEAGRWQQIIGLVQSQMSRIQGESSQFDVFMQQIMHLSLKNKQILQIGSPKKIEQALPRLDSKGKLKTVKADRQYLVHPEEILQQNAKENIQNTKQVQHFVQDVQVEPVLDKVINPISSFQSTCHLKRLLSTPSDDHVYEMLLLRQDLLKKRQVEEMRKLNIDLQGKCITQQVFLDRLQAIQDKYSQQKVRIDRTKEDISKGFKAAQKLAQEAVSDAKKLGYDVPFSRSVQGLRHKRPLLGSDLLIDEISKYRRQDRPRQMLPRPPQLRESQQGIHISLSSDAESSDLQFNEDQLWRFRQARPDLQLAGEIADLGRNVMISEELLRQQQAEEGVENQLMMTQHVCREIYEIEQASPPRCSPRVDHITQWLTTVILWEATGQLLLRPLFAERLIDKTQKHLKPTAVTDKERLLFLSLLEKYFPPTSNLTAKLNQKICPLPTQLLRCMRIDFSQEDEDDNSYEQIGKYEFIIGQEVCNQAIQEFRAKVDANTPTVVPAVQQISILANEYNFSQKLLRYLLQREKYTCNRSNHTRQLRWEVLNIEIHCIFDAWNEELIALRSEKAGYSGIGLNQLTLSVHDHNSQITHAETMPIIAEGRKKLIRTLSLSSPTLIFPQAVEQEDEQILDEDSKWIFYADEALSYGLELVYLMEQDIFNEMAKEIRKISPQPPSWSRPLQKS